MDIHTATYLLSQHILVARLPIIEVVLLLRELEAKVLLVDGRTHGKVRARTAACTEHEVWSKLGTTGGAEVVLLLLLGGKGSKAGRREVLREGATRVSGLVRVLRDFALFGEGVTVPIFCVLHHGTEIRRVRIGRPKRGRTKRSRLAVPRRLLGRVHARE